MMDTPVVVVKKLKAEEASDGFCAKFGLNSTSAAACREALAKRKLNTTGKILHLLSS
jgi:hypothetical protein